METSLVPPRSGGRSRFSKALPAPPALDTTNDIQVALPVRKDSLPSRPALPPKDNAVRSIPSDMATKVMNAPLPRLPSLPSLSRVNSPPTVMPKRKPVGSGASVKSAKSPPPPPPAVTGSGEISPVGSFSSLFSAYGTEDSAARYSVDTAATKHSFSESSPPRLPPKDSLAKPVINRLDRLDIVSPLSLPTPVSSTMDTTRQQQQQQQQQQPELSRSHGQDDRPPTPPSKDRQRPTATMSPKAVDDDSPTSLTNQSPSQPQLWRRRSLKTDKPLAVPELKLTLSHGSTAASQQVTSSMDNSSMNNEPPSLPNPNFKGSSTGAGAGAGGDSPILNGFRANLPGRNIRPSPSQNSLPRNPSPDKMGNKKSKEGLDGFSQYAQEVEDSMHNGTGTFMAPQYSPARRSPETRRPPTPEYAKDESQSNDPTVYSPVSPMTPPEDLRPLSVIQEDAEGATAMPAAPPPSGPLPGLPPRSSSRPGIGGALAVNASPGRMALPSSPRPPNRSPLGASSPATAAAAAASLAPAPAIQPASLGTPVHERSTSSTSVPAIEVFDDGDASTIKAPNSPRPTTSASTITTMTAAAAAAAASQQGAQAQAQAQAPSDSGPMSPTSPTALRPGDPAYFPMRHHHAAANMTPIAPGTVLAASALKKSQLACLGSHYRFLPSRNEDHPLSCQSCQIRDNGARFTCAHCAVRICADCRDVLMMNGRDLGKLVEMLKA